MRKKIEDKLLKNRIIKLLNREILPLTTGEITNKIKKNSEIKRSNPVVDRHIRELVEEDKIITEGEGKYRLANKEIEIINRCIHCNKEKASKNLYCAKCFLKMKKGEL